MVGDPESPSPPQKTHKTRKDGSTNRKPHQSSGLRASQKRVRKEKGSEEKEEVPDLLEPGPVRPELSERPVLLLAATDAELRQRVLGHDVSIRQLLHPQRREQPPGVRPVFQHPFPGLQEHSGGHRAVGIWTPRGKADVVAGVGGLVDWEGLEEGDVSRGVAVGAVGGGEERHEGVAILGVQGQTWGGEEGQLADKDKR